MLESNKCVSCGNDWSEGKFTPDCAECGGGALQKACPKCRGLCGGYWRRAILDSQDEHLAHWVGICCLDEDKILQEHILSNVSAEWWLDDSALPDLYWACLLSSQGKKVVVVDSDATAHIFANHALATMWLREEEYDLMLSLKEQNEIDSDVLPPARIVALALQMSIQFNSIQ